jgi:C-terminal of NADH-ubiquinone oxidoreductase 21 kDa subunit
MGLIGGFLMAYQDSSSELVEIVCGMRNSNDATERFWGWSENTREQELDRIEMTKKIAEGKPLYGTSDQPEHMQRVAVSNSRHSQLFFSIIPW